MKIVINSHTLYECMLALIVLNQSLGSSEVFAFYNDIKILVHIVIGFLAIWQIFFDARMTYKQLLTFSLFLISAYTSYIIEQTWLLYLFLSLVFIRDKQIDKIIRVVFYCSFIPYMINTIVFIFDYLQSPGSLKTILQYGTDLRYFMFYNSPNNSARIYLFSVLAYLYINYDSLNYKKIAIVLVSWIFIYHFTQTDALIVILGALMLILLSKYKIVRPIYFLRLVIFPLGLLFSVAYIMFHTIPDLSLLFLLINAIFVGRLGLSTQVYDMYGWTFWGNKIELGYQTIGDFTIRFICDNGYIFTMTSYGVFYLLIVFYLLFSLRKTVLPIKVDICIIVWSLYWMVENRIFDFPSVFPFILLYYYWINRHLVNDSNFMN